MPDLWPAAASSSPGDRGSSDGAWSPSSRRRGADVVAPRSAEYDLTVPGAAEEMLADHRPDDVVHLAARVGGIGYNQAEPAPLYLANLLMGTHVIEAARATPSVDKTVLVGTVCSYPKFTPVPFREESLWDGYPEETNAPYGMAKKAHLVHAQVNAAQYGQRFAYLIPTNLYGPGDKFHPSRVPRDPGAHQEVRRGQRARATTRSRCGAPAGPAASTSTSTTPPRRSCSRHADVGTTIPEPINLGTNHEVTIRETVETIARLVGFTGELRWDPTKPDGQPRRRVDATRAEHAARLAGQMPFEDGPAGDDRLVHRQPRRGRAPPLTGRIRQGATMPATTAGWR